VDSPLAVKLTDVFKLHPECLDEEARGMVEGRDSPFEFPELRYVQSVEDSKRVTASTEPAIVISASGMCEAGRILHHLRATVGDPKHAILIVGFQAPHTLGRRLVEKREQVRIFGIMHDRRAEVVVLNGFSAHADQQDLRDFTRATRERGAVERVMLVHGDPQPQKILAGLLAEDGAPRVDVPAPGDRLEI
jgi:metallo-beta-lactamase family protein